MNYYLDVWRGYFDFSGRARRKEYWWFTLYHTVLLVTGGLLFEVSYKDNTVIGTIFGAIVVLYYLASLIPSISVTVRRLHDIDKSGWWYFINFVPAIGGLWALVLMCIDGTRGPNQYGPDPKSVDLMAV